MKVTRILSIMCLVLIAEQGTVLHAQRAYRETTVRNGGTVHGVVRLVGSPMRIPVLPVAKDQTICGSGQQSPRLSLGSPGGVRNCVVYLDNIRSGKRNDKSIKPVLDQKDCTYDPHVVLLPPGATLEIVNSDPILHNVHTYNMQRKMTTVFNIAQPIRGQRTPLPALTFDGPGFYRATCDAGHPWMSAYIVLTEHPYYTVTDREGRYVLDDIPPGKYRLVMWHEGVYITRKDMEKGAVKQYSYEDPYILTKEIEVSANDSLTVHFQLELRKYQ